VIEYGGQSLRGSAHWTRRSAGVAGPGGGDGVAADGRGVRAASGPRGGGVRLRTIRPAHHDVERRPRWTLA